jgi:hypothetical protein
MRTLVLTGNGFASEEAFFIELIAGELAAAGARAARTGPAREAAAAQTGPRTVRRLARRVRAIRRPLGIAARFGRRDRRVVLRSREVRFDGRVELRLRVSAARR